MTRLREYQKESVRKIIKFNGRALVAADPGLGKTLIALTYLRAPEQKPALVVCPAVAKWVWKNEIRKHTKLSCRVLSGRTPKKLKTLRDVTIINYDILSAWTDVLRQSKFNTLILDECQYGKNPKSQRTKAVANIGKTTRSIIAMSGTPLVNRPKELFPTLKLLRPHQYKSFVPFAFRYCNRHITPWGWDDSGASHLDELHKQLSSNCMIRYRKEDVLTELPPKQRIVVTLPIPNIAEYHTAEREFISWVNTIDPTEKQAKAQGMVKLTYLKQLAAELKLPSVISWIDDFLDTSNEKLIVFTYHRKIIQHLFHKYPQSVMIDGSVSDKERDVAIRKFQNDKDVRIFFGQILAAGTAITLTAASTCVFAEMHWVPGIHLQAEDRCILKGQPILTPNGWKPVEKIKKGDVVISSTGNPRKVLKTYSRTHKGMVTELTIAGWPKPIKVTSDHRLSVQGQWKEALDIKPGDLIDMPKRENTKTRNYIRSNKSTLKKVQLTPNALFTFGYYIDNGFCRTRIPSGGSISLVGSKTNALHPCKKWLLEMGAHVETNKQGIKANSPKLSQWLSNHFGRTYGKKKIPQWVFHLSRTQQQQFLDGLLANRRDSYQYTTTNKELASQVARLILMCGHKPSLNYNTATSYYQIRLSKGGQQSLSVLKVKHNFVGKTTQVYDLQVEKEHNFVVGLSVVHNCHRLGQTKQVQAYYLVAKDTVEERICKYIQRKADIVKTVLDGEDAKNDMKIFDMLTHAIMQKEK